MVVGGAGDHGQPVRLDHAHADHADEGVGTALGYRKAGRQAEMVGGSGGEAADHGAERQDLARPAVEQGRQVQLVEQAGGVSGAVVVVPAGRCAGDVGDHAAGQVKVDVVLAVADVGGAV